MFYSVYISVCIYIKHTRDLVNDRIPPEPLVSHCVCNPKLRMTLLRINIP